MPRRSGASNEAKPPNLQPASILPGSAAVRLSNARLSGESLPKEEATANLVTASVGLRVRRAVPGYYVAGSQHERTRDVASGQQSGGAGSRRIGNPLPETLLRRRGGVDGGREDSCPTPDSDQAIPHLVGHDKFRSFRALTAPGAHFLKARGSVPGWPLVSSRERLLRTNSLTLLDADQMLPVPCSAARDDRSVRSPMIRPTADSRARSNATEYSWSDRGHRPSTQPPLGQLTESTCSYTNLSLVPSM